MATKNIDWENDINLAGNQIKNVVVDVVETLPTTDNKEGRIVSMAGDLYIYKGSAYVKLGASGDVENLKTRMTTAEGKITTLEGEMDTAQTDISTNASDIDALEGRMDTAEGDIDAIEGSAYATSGITQAKVAQYDAYATGKQDALSEAQMNAVNSGITSAKVTKLDGIAEGAEVNVIETVKLNGTALAVTDKAVDVDLSADYYTKTEIDGKISGAFHYKGAVATYADLPKSGMVKGDVYNIQTADPTHDVKAGDNAVWDGSTWDILSGIVDLSAYYTKTEANTLLDGKVDKVTGKGLSTNDLTDALKSTYDGYATLIQTNANDIDALESGKVDVLATKPTAGTYTKVTINAEGQVTAGANISASDVPDIAISQVTGLQTALDGKVDEVEGAGLYPDADKTKVAGIEAGAQVNVIEEIQKNGAKITPVDKVVNITVPTNNNELTNGAGYQTASDVASAINTAKANYYDKTAIQGFFTSELITTTGSDANGYSATVNIDAGVPFMAQVLNGSGDVVMASITIGASSVTVNTNSAFTGTLKVLALPN